MKKLAIISFLSFICLFFTGISSAENIQNPILLDGKTSRGVPVIIEVCTIKDPSEIYYKYNQGWGTMRNKPKNLITNIDIKFGNQQGYLSLSAYCDLTNSYDYSLKFMENSYILVIRGGSASTSYTAELTFENLFLQKRKVTHGEFPDQTWEETIYSYILESQLQNSSNF